MVKLRGKKVRNGYSLYIDYYHKGKRDFEFLEICVSQDYTSAKKTKRVAAIDRKKWEVAREIFLEKELAFIRNGYTFQKATVEIDWIEYLTEKVQEKKHKTYDAMFKWLHKFIATGKAFEPTQSYMESFQNYLSLQKLGDTSIHHYLNRLRIILNVAINEEKLSKNPFDRIHITKTNEREQEYLSVPEIALLDASTEGAEFEVRMAFLFSCYTGLRYSELTALKWADVRESETIPYIKITEKKTKKERIVQLHEYPLSIIQKITRTQPNEKVFALPNNQKANDSLRAWCKAVSITKEIHFHSARHTFGTMLHDTGTDIYTVQEIYGHSSLDMTKSYAKVTDKKRVNAINSLQNPLKL